jgi:hypothetical protein
MNERLENYAHLGLSHEEMAPLIGLTLKEFQGWLLREPRAKLALKRGGPEATARVARVMYLNAVGYEHDEEKVFCNAEGDVTRVQTVKRYAPNHVSGIFYLKNKDPSRWRDRHEIDAGAGMQKLVGTWAAAVERLGLRGDLQLVGGSERGGQIYDGEVAQAGASDEERAA